MDVNEYERWSSITLKTQNQVKAHHFYFCSAFHSHSRVFTNKNNSYPKMNVNFILNMTPTTDVVRC